MSIVNFIVKLNITDEQIALALRCASTNKTVRKYFKSAGLVDVKDHATLKHMAGQTKKIIQSSRQTEHLRGRAPDSQRHFANSLVLSVAATPPPPTAEDLVQHATQQQVPSRSKLIKLLGLPKSSGLRAMKQMEKKRQELRQGMSSKLEWQTLISSRRGFYKKLMMARESKSSIGSDPILV